MPRNLQNYLDAMTHALGKTPDSRHSLISTLNDAGRELYMEREWSWRTSQEITIHAVADQNWIALPTDFSQISSAYIDAANAGTGFNHVSLVSQDAIHQMRQASSAGGSDVLYMNFPRWSSSASTDSTPQPRVIVYPTPTQNDGPIVTITYRRRWRSFMSSSDTKALANIPEEWEEALILLARAKAIVFENPENPQKADGTYKQYAATIEKLHGEDRHRQQQYGRIVGGADSRIALAGQQRHRLGTITL